MSRSIGAVGGVGERIGEGGIRSPVLDGVARLVVDATKAGAGETLSSRARTLPIPRCPRISP